MGPPEFPDGSAQRGFLGTRPFYLFVPKDRKPVWEEEVERQGLHSHLLFEATPMAGLARELRAALGPGGGAQASSVRVPPAQAGGRREGQGRGLDRGRGEAWTRARRPVSGIRALPRLFLPAPAARPSSGQGAPIPFPGHRKPLKVFMSM